MSRHRPSAAFWPVLIWSVVVVPLVHAAQRPNIILILTDDQGYGDLSCHGNPVLKTPNLDRLHAQSVRFTEFHVSPTCSPTRAALLSGRHEFRSGVTHTILERERLSLRARTVADVLKSAGYATGIFGKWHLGDEVEYQPNRRGFDEVFIHGGGGIGQTYPGSCGDAPGNTYFDPAILHNGVFEKTKGYCTDVFFAQALRWIETQPGGRPFYAHIATNAPHAPLDCPPEYEKLYAGKVPPNVAKFFGMIANIDDNVGRLLDKLHDWSIERDTLVIFMNDNGGTAGVPIYNAGMRGQKVTPWRGGTRAASFWRWPGVLEPGDRPQLAAHIDFVPTLAELAGAELAPDVVGRLEGRSLVPLLKDSRTAWPDRTLFTHVGRWPKGEAAKFKDHAVGVRNTRFHLVNEKGGEAGWQLFDVQADPGETKDIGVDHPDAMHKLRAALDQWWASVQPDLINEDAVGPKSNPFKELYWKQFGGGPKGPAAQADDKAPVSDVATGREPRLEWAGEGAVRVVVKVPELSAGRVGDERPAEVVIDFEKLLAGIGPGRRPDLSTLQVVAHDPATGVPMQSVRFAFGRGKFDVPCRWYDDEIGYEFPEVFHAVSSTGEVPRYETRTRFGYFYDCIGDWKSGRLVFSHRVRNAPSWYAVYFDLLPPGREPESAPPRGFVGDGLQRCTLDGASTTGLIHSRVEVADWDGDGLFDLLVGCARGGVVWYPNRGEPGRPRFPFSKLVRTRDGRPLDVGWSAAPHAVDWDGDGRLDLLVGAEWNRLLLYLNRGVAGRPDLEYAGPVRLADGELLTLPHEPVPESPPGVFQRDYYPVVTTADWDGDGDLDLLAGGYVTGRIFLFENEAERGTVPRLRARGPILADGVVLDVGWCAAPTVADLDRDGDLDLITGCMPVTAGGGDSASRENFLHYFRNDGSRTQPALHRIDFPRDGQFPHSALGTPRLVDFSGDGLLDLVVSAYTDIYLFRNVGTADRPRFEAHERPLPSRWGSTPLAAVQFVDWNGDGLPDGLNGTQLYRNAGRGNPGIFQSPVSLLPPGQVISHLSGIGDDWQFQRLFDLDRDGLLDLMDADHGGHVWWHRNSGTRDAPDFEPAGIRLSLTSGEPVRVGLDRTGFDALQGARATYTVGDFDGDGDNDLVVADTFGIVRYFRQTARERAAAEPRFESPIEIGKLRIRAVPFAADWNGDGQLDVVAGSSADDVVVFLNRGKENGLQREDNNGRSPFHSAQKLDLPSAPYGAGAPLVVTDFDGDGDTDLLIHTAYGYTCLYERSFIESGYARGDVIRLEQRAQYPAPGGAAAARGQEAAPSWVKVTDQAGWQPRDSQGEVAYKDQLWIFGGWFQSFEAPPRDVWSSPDGKTWRQVAKEAPWKHSDLAMTLVFDDKMWIMGGWYNGRLPGHSASSAVWWSTDGVKWEQATPSAGWSPRIAAAVVEFKGKMWLLGGTENYYFGDDTSLKNDVWYSADGREWKLATEHAGWSPRAYHQAVVLNDKICVFGGGNYVPQYHALNDVWCSEDGINWTQVTDAAPWPPRLWFSSVVYRDRMWVLGGWSNNPSKNWGDVWYSKDGKNWTQLKSDVVWKERHEHSAFVFQDKIWIAGGHAQPLSSEVWSLELPKNWTAQVGRNAEFRPTATARAIAPDQPSARHGQAGPEPRHRLIKELGDPARLGSESK